MGSTLYPSPSELYVICLLMLKGVVMVEGAQLHIHLNHVQCVCGS